MVRGNDLFAREANFHLSCRKLFSMQCITHLNDKNGLIDEKQDVMAFAYHKALIVVLDFFQGKVIGQNQVVQLSSQRFLYILQLKRSG